MGIGVRLIALGEKLRWFFKSEGCQITFKAEKHRVGSFEISSPPMTKLPIYYITIILFISTFFF